MLARFASRLLALLAAMVIMIGLASAAMAFPRTFPAAACNGGPKVWYEFYADGWTQPLMQAVYQAIEDWEQALTRTGARLVEFRQDPPAGWDYNTHVYIWFTSMLPDGVMARTTCDSPSVMYVELNEDLRQEDPGYLAVVAAHEMGHTVWLIHTGDEDSYGTNDNPSRMATCVAPGVYLHYSQDDAQDLTHKKSTGGNLPLTANRSFEEGDLFPTYWGRYGLGTWDIIISQSAPFGDNYLSWTPSGVGQYVYQTHNYSMASGYTVDIALTFKNMGSGSGQVTAQLWRKYVDYGPVQPDSCAEGQYPGDVDMNTRASVSPNWVRIDDVTSSWTVTSQWLTYNTNPDYEIDHDVDWDAFDLQLRIYSSVMSGGIYTAIGLDDVRVRDTG